MTAEVSHVPTVRLAPTVTTLSFAIACQDGMAKNARLTPTNVPLHLVSMTLHAKIRRIQERRFLLACICAFV
jgi:hypothetical protein